MKASPETTEKHIRTFLNTLYVGRDYEFTLIRDELKKCHVHFSTTQALTKALQRYCQEKGYSLKSNMQDGRYMRNGKRYVCFLREE